MYCESSICIGKKSRISWDSQIFDTNFHYMIEQSGRIKRMNGEIFIGDECWIGNRVTIQKGTKISDKSVVASNSLLNKDFSSDGSEGNIYAGNPAILKRKGYTRVFDFGLQEKIDEYFKNYPKCDSVNIADVIS